MDTDINKLEGSKVTVGKPLTFYKKSHKYKVGKKELTSVTTFIGKFFEPFDAKAIAKKLATFYVNKKNKRGMRYWLKTWKEDAAHGTRTHELIENILSASDGEVILCKERDRLKLDQALYYWQLFQKVEDVYDTLTELRIYDEELGIAGTIDLFVVHKDKSITLIDWKTNKAIKKIGYNHKKAFEPIEDWEDCNYNKYTLQLSLYAYLLERKGHKIKELILVHLKEDEFVDYDIKYEKEVIEKLLQQN